MTDQELIEDTKALLKSEAALDLKIIENLRMIHARKLYLAHGSPSFHAFCTQVLGMSSDSAWRRMHAASLADRFPNVVKPLIAEGKVHLTGLALLDRVITPANGERLIHEAVGKSTTEIKAMIAREAPELCKPGVRKLPTKQLSASTWQFKAVMDAETHALLKEVEDLENSSDSNHILREALRAYRDALRVKKQKALKRPASANAAAASVPSKGAKAVAKSPPATGSKAQHPGAASMRRRRAAADSYVPRWMERTVRERDGHRCTFVGHGGRCTARRDLQVHHIVAVALGGPTEVSNLTLHCGAHNRYQAELDLGEAVANAWRRKAG